MKKLIAVAAVVAALGVVMLMHTSRSKPPVAAQPARTNEVRRVTQTAAADPLAWGSVAAKHMTEEEKAELVKRFEKRFKPALEHWAGIYGDHLPFRLVDVKPERFAGMSMGLYYTFMVDSYAATAQGIHGDITLTMEDNDKKPAHVFYMAARQGMMALNQVPTQRTMPDLSMPMTRQDAEALVLADGADLKKYQLMTSPTGNSAALRGGMLVNVGLPDTGHGEPITEGDIHIVFDQNGKLVTYCK